MIYGASLRALMRPSFNGPELDGLRMVMLTLVISIIVLRQKKGVIILRLFVLNKGGWKVRWELGMR
jgi:hypothetical protein